MNETKRIERESYEAPAVQDIEPVTINVVRGEHSDPNWIDPES